MNTDMSKSKLRRHPYQSFQLALRRTLAVMCLLAWVVGYPWTVSGRMGGALLKTIPGTQSGIDWAGKLEGCCCEGGLMIDGK